MASEMAIRASAYLSASLDSTRIQSHKSTSSLKFLECQCLAQCLGQGHPVIHLPARGATRDLHD